MDWVWGWCDRGWTWGWAWWLRVLAVVFVGVFKPVAGERTAEGSQEPVVYLMTRVRAGYSAADRAHNTFILAVWAVLGGVGLRRGERAGSRGVGFLLHEAVVVSRSGWW